MSVVERVVSASPWRVDAARVVTAHHYGTLATILILGSWLRLTGLRRQSLWFDEADIVVRAQRPLIDVMTAFTTAGENGPLYNVLLAIWIRIAGISEIAVRAPSAVAGVLGILAIYMLGRYVAGPLSGLFAAGLLAISPYHIWYSQEAKMYSLVVLLAILSTLLLVYALRRNERHAWVFYVILTTLMFYTHVVTVLVFGAHVIYGAIVWRRWPGRHRAMLLSAAALTLPYLPIAAWALRVVGGDVPTWQPDVSLVEAIRIVGIKLAANRSTIEIENRSAVIYALLAGAGALAMAYRSDRRPAALLLALLVIVPVIGIYLVSIRNSVFSDRYAITALPAYLVLAGAALAAGLRSRIAWPLSVLAIFVVITLAWIPIRDVNRSSEAEKEDWRSAYARIADRAEPDDVILLHPGYIITTHTYYSQRDTRLQRNPVATIPSFNVNWLTREIMIDLLRIDVAPRDRFWLVQSPDRVPAQDPDNTLESWLNETGEVLYDETLNGVEITLYDLPERWWEPSASVVRYPPDG